MFDRLRRIFNPPHRRALEAGGGGRRWDPERASENLNADIFGSHVTVARRARYAALNNPWCANGINTFAANVAGTGIKPQSRHPDPTVRQNIHSLFDTWTEDADAAGLTDFYGLQSMLARGLVQPGESFVRLRTRRPGDGLEVPLQLEMLGADQVDPTLHRNLDGGAYIRAGVEFDALGRRVAYHVFRDRPGDPFATSLAPRRVPASEILHVFTPLEPGQVRGLSRLSSVLLRLKELDDFEDATLVGQKVRALFTAFILRTNEGTAPFGLDRGANFSEAVSLEPGSLWDLPFGEDVKFADPKAGGDDFAAFVSAQLRGIAAGIGCTYEQLSGDMTGVNYSSARVALLEFRRKVEALQEQVVIHQFLRPTWRRFITTAVLAGALPAPGFDRDPRPWLAVKWITPAWDWIDPLKDIQAEEKAVAACFKSRSEVIGARGWDPEQVDAEIAADQERADRLGLRLGGAGLPIVPVEDTSNAGN